MCGVRSILEIEQLSLSDFASRSRDKRFDIGGYAIESVLISKLSTDNDIELFDKIFPLKTPVNYLPSQTSNIIRRGNLIKDVDDYLKNKEHDQNNKKKNISTVTISGMAGAGKTYFSIDLSRYLSTRFPDGQLYINLNGFSDVEEIIPKDIALDALLRQIGVDKREIPISLEEKVKMWNDCINSFNGIIILDNAFNSQHVHHLIPDSSQSLILITSRNKLPELKKTLSLQIGSMSLDESKELFSFHSLIPILNTKEEEYLVGCVDRCGRLPLALRVVGSLWANKADNYQEIYEWMLECGDDVWMFKNSDTNVESLFSTSFKILDKSLLSIFFVCASLPGRTFSLDRVKAILGKKHVQKIDIFLLCDYSLVQIVDNEYFSIHDVLRLYGRNHYEENTGLSLIDSILVTLEFYLNKYNFLIRDPHHKNIQIIYKFIYEEGVNIYETCSFLWRHSYSKALELIRIIAHEASRVGINSIARQLYTLEFQIVSEKSNDVTEVLYSQLNIANVYMSLGDFIEAEKWYLLAYDLSKNKNSAESVSLVLSQLAFCYERLGAYDKAFANLEESEIIANKNNDIHSISRIYSSRGAVYWRLHKYNDALIWFNMAAELRDKENASDKDGSIDNNIGLTYFCLNNIRLARKYLWKSLKTTINYGNINSLAVTEVNLGYTYAKTNRPYIGEVWARKGLKRAIDTDNRFQEARAYDALGDSYLAMRKNSEAKECWQKAERMFRSCGAPEFNDMRAKLTKLIDIFEEN